MSKIVLLDIKSRLELNLLCSFMFTSFSGRVTGLFSQFQSGILIPDGCAVSFFLHW